jgi:hypothetical protein
MYIYIVGFQSLDLGLSGCKPLKAGIRAIQTTQGDLPEYK